jgi:hypothetical protein
MWQRFLKAFQRVGGSFHPQHIRLGRLDHATRVDLLGFSNRITD